MIEAGLFVWLANGRLEGVFGETCLKSLF